MANRERNKTKEESHAEKSIEIPKMYAYDRFQGNKFMSILPEILNKRYADGWKFIKVYFIFEDSAKIPPVKNYAILYKKRKIEEKKGFLKKGKQKQDK